MRKIVSYLLIKSDEECTLQGHVKDVLDDDCGWELYGYPFLSKGGEDAQAMVKYIENDIIDVIDEICRGAI